MSKSILGIDVSKKELMLALLLDDNSIHKKKFSNDQQGFKEILKWLKSRKIEQVKACMEATGDYGTKLADFLYDKGHEVNIINPACIKAFGNSKLVRTKTDEIDAVIIAEYGKKSNLVPYKPKSPELKELKYLYRCLNDLKKQNVEVINHLENKDSLPKSVCNLWKRLSKNLQKEIKIVETGIEELLAKHSDIKQQYEKLQTIPGIAKTTAIAILAESPDLSQFANARQYAAYAGLVPKHRSSGSSVRGKARLSKLGSSKLRKAVYFPAIVAKNHNPIMQAFSAKLKRKGKHTMVIIGAIMRKLLHIIFGVLKHNKSFEPEHIELSKNNISC